MSRPTPPRDWAYYIMQYSKLYIDHNKPVTLDRAVATWPLGLRRFWAPPILISRGLRIVAGGKISHRGVGWSQGKGKRDIEELTSELGIQGGCLKISPPHANTPVPLWPPEARAIQAMASQDGGHNSIGEFLITRGIFSAIMTNSMVVVTALQMVIPPKLRVAYCEAPCNGIRLSL